MRSRIETREERGDGGANALPQWNDAPGQMWLGPTAWIVGMMAQRKFRSWHPEYSSRRAEHSEEASRSKARRKLEKKLTSH
jgi:hypothetical protein